MNKTICLIAVYYGELPFWMSAFYLTCKYNPQISWILVTDNKAPGNLPANIQFIDLSLAELNHLINQKIDGKLKIEDSYAYKLCDYKPAYGLLFQDFIKDYDYWGHCDLDIVWGDVCRFLQQERFDNYDIFTSRKEQISGHFCLYKNTLRVNSFFKEIPFWVRQLKKRYRYCGIDEKYLSSLLRRKSNFPVIGGLISLFLYTNRPSLRVYWNKVLATAGVHQREMLSTTGASFVWKEGKTYHIDGSELMYIHFHKIKKTMKMIGFRYEDNSSEFIIRADGFFTVK